MRFLLLSVLMIAVGIGVVGCEHDDDNPGQEEEVVDDSGEAPRASSPPALPDPVDITWDGFDMATCLTVGGQSAQELPPGQLAELHLTVDYQGSTPTNFVVFDSANANFFIEDEGGTGIWSSPPPPPGGILVTITIQPGETLKYSWPWQAETRGVYVLQARWEPLPRAPSPQFWFRVAD